ncbi:L,D-transpeptidase [Tropicimonas sp.]|uniref:L,D-transpeptidase n=1 Tax=Tropicimonas sp. TaxID=2067044 RepID=UPI003A871275
MFSRRDIVLGTAALLATPSVARAADQETYELPKQFRTYIVRAKPEFRPGEIIILTRQHFLYFILPDEKAIRYGVAVGSEGRNLSGSAVVRRKAEWPSWTPTANMIRREPQVYRKFAGGMPGGPENPLGARALYLYRGGRDTRYRIHGTPQPWTIGRSVSSGCIRLHNDAIIDLYNRAPVGTRVTVY